MQDQAAEERTSGSSLDATSPREANGRAAPSKVKREEPALAESSGEEPAGSAQSALRASEGVSERNLDLILDVPLHLSVELGRTKILIRDLMQLGRGSIVELAKEVGEPVEVLVNDKLIARGEVVVVEDKFGVRLTDIVSPSERVEKLR